MLAVDDEPAGRRQLELQLTALGHQPSLAASAGEVQEILTREGSAAFDCMITDCCLPGTTGMELLLWLKDHDWTLASIVIGQVANTKMVTQTLRSGASDFLQKPVVRDELEVALQRAIQSTQRRRRHAATRSAVREVGLVQRRMNNLGRAHELPVSVTVCFHPCHDAGGDSVAFFSTGPAQVLVVVADVSGHDLKSAFISAHFQGMLRAMVEQKVPAHAILERFNRFLINEWSTSPEVVDDPVAEITSLSVCSASIDLDAGSVNFLNSGFPLANRVDRDGQPWPCGETGGSPLGWFDPNPLTGLSLAVAGSDRLVIWTDGLEELAYKMQIAEWSLVFRVLQAKEARQTPPWLAAAPDDILLVVIGMTLDHQTAYPFPILAESYKQIKVANIDELQERWRRSLAFAFPGIERDRLSEILLCTREAVLNGLLHGCSTGSDRCRLTMVFNSAHNKLQIDVEDPGPGHHFDHLTRASGELVEDHRGLLLINGLAERVERSPTGSALRMFFGLGHDAEERQEEGR